MYKIKMGAKQIWMSSYCHAMVSTRPRSKLTRDAQGRIQTQDVQGRAYPFISSECRVGIPQVYINNATCPHLRNREFPLIRKHGRTYGVGGHEN